MRDIKRFSYKCLFISKIIHIFVQKLINNIMEKKIYPEYHLFKNYDNNEYFTFIRKKRDDGVYFLIPIRKRFYFKNNEAPKNRENEIDMFHKECYRVFVLYKVHKDGELHYAEHPWCICEEKDTNQRDEKYRLNYYRLNYNTKVL